MPILYLTTRGTRACVSGERMDVELPAETEGSYPRQNWVPLIDIEHVVVDTEVNLSARSIAELLQREIPVLLLSNGSFPHGICTPINRQTLPLAAQLDTCRRSEDRLRLARTIVEAKVLNMKRVLQRLAANRKVSDPLVSSWLNAMANQVRAAASLDTLRGLEGAATGRYFETLGSYFPPDMPFERRSRRPPHNPVNALLSFLYTLLTSEFTLHIMGAGLEPGWGIYHESEDGRPALALDLMEPFRAPLCDSLALDLINHRQLTNEHFHPVDGGIHLRREARRTLFAALENRLEREFNYERTQSRTTLRNLIKDHVMQMKRIFREGGELIPFAMN